MTSSEGVDDALVGRCYTRARTLPPMVGQLSFPGGEKRQLWGGPYTAHQMVAFFIGWALVWITRGIWGSMGAPAVVVALLSPFAAGFFVRHARVDGRSPFAVIAGWLTYWAQPAAGRLRGRTFRPKRELLVTLNVHQGRLPVLPTLPVLPVLPVGAEGGAGERPAGDPMPDSRAGNLGPEPTVASSGPQPARAAEPVASPPGRSTATAAPARPSAAVVTRRRPASHLELLLSAQRSADPPDARKKVG